MKGTNPIDKALDMRRGAMHNDRASHRKGPKIRMRRVRSSGAICALFAILAFAGCGGGGSSSTTIQSIAIAPTAATVPVNTQSDFVATVTLTDSTVSTTTTVTWQVNGVAGGNSTFGTIAGSPTDELVGVYTAPAQVPTTSSGSGGLQIGQVSITAVAQQPTSTSCASNCPSVTSNAAVVTVGSGLGLVVSPAAKTVSAGSSYQFTALLNSLTDPSATWTVTSPSGVTDSSVIGTVDATTGLYTAPTSPPPGGTVTITASDPTAAASATATVTILFSDRSLSGPYAFSYTGNDQSGFLAAAGSFVADGAGHIVSGVEDINSFLTGISTQVPLTGTYSVGPDGRGTATITRGGNTESWRFVLSTSQHARITRFDQNVAAGGTIDQQSVEALTNSAALVSGPYVFSVLGADSSFKPLGMAGEFVADGAGNIPAPPTGQTVLDVNDNGTVTAADNSLNGSYAFDSSFPGTGRGTLTLESSSTGTREYAFYTVGTAVNSNTSADYVTQLHLVEIDHAASVAGDAFSSPSGAGFSGNLNKANYVFTTGGNSSQGAYASGGVLVSDGSGNITGGVLDTNNAGATALKTALGSCPYSLDTTLHRIDLRVYAGGGTCPAGSSPGVSEFAAYQTSVGSVLLLEIDPNAVATGVAYQQCGPSSAGCAAATPALNATSASLGLVGQGIFYNSPASYQQDVDGRIALTASAAGSGSIDINNFSALFANDSLSSSSLAAPDSTGRGTVVLSATSPSATYNLIYYLIDDHTALVLDKDSTFVLNGAVTRQF